MSFDPSQNAAIIEALTLRSDGQSFVFAVDSVPFGTQSAPGGTTSVAMVAAFSPRTMNVLLLSWNARYRNTLLSGALTCDAGVLPVAEAALLSAAVSAFDLTDLHLSTLGTTLPLGSSKP